MVRDAATFIPVRDIRGALHKYKQVVTTIGVQEESFFSPEEIIYLRLFPKSYSIYGTPLIDAVSNEVTALLYAGKSFADALSEEAAKDGILHLGQVGSEAYERIRQQFQEA